MQYFGRHDACRKAVASLNVVRQKLAVMMHVPNSCWGMPRCCAHAEEDALRGAAQQA